MLDPLGFYKLLADETRLKSIILIAAEGELCVCELVEALDEIQPKVSRHLALLREQKIVLDRRQGQWIYYRLNPELPHWVQQVIAETAQANTAYVAANKKKLCNMPARPAKTMGCC